METTKLSSKGQVIIPKRMRALHQWEQGLELNVIDTGDGLLLKPKTPFPETTLSEVSGCLKHHGPAKSLEDMENAIQQGIEESYR